MRFYKTCLTGSIILGFVFVLMGSGVSWVYYSLALLFLVLAGYLVVKQRNLNYERFLNDQIDNWNKSKNRKYNQEVYGDLEDFHVENDREFRLDDQTWKDLNMEALFKRIDTTLTIPGQQVLYNTLRNISLDKEVINEKDKSITLIASNKEIRKNLIEILAKIGTREGEYTTHLLFRPFYFNERYVKYLKLSRLALPLSLVFMFVSFQVGVVAAIVAIAFNTRNYYHTKKHIGAYSDAMKYMSRVMSNSTQLREATSTQLCVDFDKLDAALKKTSSIRKKFDNLVFGNSQRGKVSELTIFYDYINMIFLIEPILFYDAMKGVETYLEDMKTIYDSVGKLDMLLCGAALRSNSKIWSTPVIKEGSSLSIEEACYSLIDQPIPNSICVQKGNGVMITGSNMSGKSTFLRTIASNIVLAQSLATALAHSYCGTTLRPFTSINISDSIESDESYYLAEVKAIKRGIDAVGDFDNVIIFIDEIFNGTNRIERMAASIEILDYLKRKQAIVFVATHDLEITKEISGYENYFFKEEVSTDDILFDYRLHKGISKTSNALEILKLMKYPKCIYDGAKEKAEKFRATKH